MINQQEHLSFFLGAGLGWISSIAGYLINTFYSGFYRILAASINKFSTFLPVLADISTNSIPFLSAISLASLISA